MAKDHLRCELGPIDMLIRCKIVWPKKWVLNPDSNMYRAPTWRHPDYHPITPRIPPINHDPNSPALIYQSASWNSSNNPRSTYIVDCCVVSQRDHAHHHLKPVCIDKTLTWGRPVVVHYWLRHRIEWSDHAQGINSISPAFVARSVIHKLTEI